MTLPLNIPIDVSVQVAAQGAASPTFNLGLIVGTSGVIPTVGANSRVRLYATSNLSQMLTDGFDPADPEYIAATIVASQQPPPQYVAIAAQDLTAIATVAPTSAHGGTGYLVGDVVGVTHSGASGGMVKVLAIGTNGVVTSAAPIQGSQGTGYVVATGNATTGGAGTGLQLDVLTIGETPLQAVIAARAANSDWYLVGSCTAVKADHIAITQWAQSASPQCEYLFSTSDADAIAGLTSSVGGVLKAANYNRFQGAVLNPTNLTANPNNVYIWAAVMGLAMGLNTGLAGSYFNLPFKALVGIVPDSWTPAQVITINSQAMSVYTTYNNTYPSYTPAATGSGQFFDQILGLDMVASDIQYSVANALVAAKAIPITDAGMTTILNAVNTACEQSVARGFIAGGIWEGSQVLGLAPGDSLPNGYRAQCDKVSTQSKSDRALRKSMPIYVTLILAEAVQSITIAVYVQP